MSAFTPSMSLRTPAIALACSLVSLLAVTAARAAWPHDPSNGNLPISVAVAEQLNPVVIPDGSGGTIIAWEDTRGGTQDIYAQRVSAAGITLWTADGLPICTATNEQARPVLISDGSGGAIIAWQDMRTNFSFDVYVQRISAAGVTQWAANGVALAADASDQQAPSIASDGSGGAIVAWYGGVGNNVYARRVDAAGTPQWTANGVRIAPVASTQQNPKLVSDGAGGAIIAWEDFRSGSGLDLYAQRVSGSGVLQWGASGTPLCLIAGDQNGIDLIPDGAGGAIACWNDYRFITSDIESQHLDANGSRLWAIQGVPICAAANDQVNPRLASDGAGGAIVTWQDLRLGGGDWNIYAQRVDAAGLIRWTTDGVALCTAPADQLTPVIATDGLGGAIVAWQDPRTIGFADIYARRIDANGTPLWAANGVALCTAPNQQYVPAIAADAAGGAVAAWIDFRGASIDVYAQRIDSFGYLGNAEPTAAGVRDVPNDQGGSVKVSWSASYLDAAPSNLIDSYWILRSVPPNAAALAARAGTHPASDFTRAPAPGTLLALPNGATDYFWEFVASQPAFHVAGYSYVASMTSDSTPGSNPRTAFMVMARTAGGAQYWFSAPDSGYSVDNLAPAAPAPLTGAYGAGATHLHWRPNVESDLAGYRVYRGTSPGFVPDAGNLVSAQADTGCVDPGAAGSWYKVSAVDVHGNQSPFAVLGPGGTLDAPVAAPALALAGPWPNPLAHAGTIHFALPQRESARLAVYDPAGRRVRLLADGTLEAGPHTAEFDLRDDSGHRIAAGLYFVRLETQERSLTERLVAIR